MAKSVAARVKARRQALRRAGLRPVQIWVPDTRAPGFAGECRRQSRIIAEAEGADAALNAFMDGALSDLAASDEWR